MLMCPGSIDLITVTKVILIEWNKSFYNAARAGTGVCRTLLEIFPEVGAVFQIINPTPTKYRKIPH